MSESQNHYVEGKNSDTKIFILHGFNYIKFEKMQN